MFSVIMPVWNRANLVARAIRSVLAQTFTDYELLIIDDGSRDDSAQVIRPYLSHKVIYHRIPHRGVSAARNFGLREAQRRYIAYLDSDNAWHPDFLAGMHQALEEAAGRYEAAYCMAKMYREDRKDGAFHLVGVVGQPFAFSRLLTYNYIDLNTFVHSRKCVELAGGFDERLRCLVDWDLVLRITSRFEPLFVPKVLVDYYVAAADNAITLRESRRRAGRIVRKKNRKLNRPAAVAHDTITYTWPELPEEKFHNWVRISAWARARDAKPDTLDYKAFGFPYMLQIEPTSRCNLSCLLCPAGRNELNRERRDMTLEEFRLVVDDMERWLLFLILWDWGEPFMNRQLPDMIRYASERGIKTVTSTNGHFLQDEAYVEAILKSGLSTLIVAIDSLSPESYQVYRKRGKLDRVLAGLQKLMEMKRRLGSRTLINMRMVVMRQNEHELGQLRRLAGELGADWFTAKTLNPSMGPTALDEELVPSNPRYRRYAYHKGTYERIRVDTMCKRAWFMSNILSNGDVVPCCYDYDATMKVGNAFEQPLSELWHGPAYRALRERIYHQKDSLPHCRDCPVNYKYSEAGPFVESLDFSANLRTRLSDVWTKVFGRGPGREIADGPPHGLAALGK